MKTNGTFKADSFLNNNIEFWRDLETECIADCCGIDAFDFSDKRIKSTIQFHNADEVLNNLKALKTEFKKSNKEKVSSYILNAYFNEVEFYKFIEQIEK